ncbi:MAG: hypothetical protein ABJC07_12930 [Acidobacteriota bacterium]
MPETARILKFRPSTQGVEPSRSEVAAAVEDFLAADNPDWDAISNPDVLLAVLVRNRENTDREPARVAEQAVAIYSWLANRNVPFGLFDEKDFFLGESSLVAAGAFRQLGQYDASADWLERADTSFQHTMNPAPLVARVQYQRLALKFGQRRYGSVIEFAPALRSSFERLGLELEASKTFFMQGMALKNNGDLEGSFEVFRNLSSSPGNHSESLRARALIEVGAYHGLSERYEDAVSSYQQAATLLEATDEPMIMAHLKASIGETYRAKGELNLAIDSFRLAIKEYSDLGMAAMVAYCRVVTAETLIAAKREREAEWELIAAFPVIEAQNLKEEGAAALLLLREAVTRRMMTEDVVSGMRRVLESK